jgi:hypothetical protein
MANSELDGRELGGAASDMLLLNKQRDHTIHRRPVEGEPVHLGV